MSQPAFDFRCPSVDERLIEEIWDSIADEAEAAPDVLPPTSSAPSSTTA